MSLIENAVNKLRRSGALPQTPARALDARALASSAPALPKVSVPAKKIHIAQADLIRAGLLAPSHQAARLADEFRRIKRPLLANASNPEARANTEIVANAVMITSPLAGVGKSFCALNLAMGMGFERELTVLLVDADVAKPRVSRELGLAEAPGLIDLLLDDARTADEVIVQTDLNGIFVLPAGRSHPQATELLASARMSALLGDLANRFSSGIIVIDSPPLLITSEAQALASHIAQITLVVEAGGTSYQQLAQSVETLDPTKAVNVILNKARTPGWSGDYAGEYGGGYGDAEPERPR